MAKTKKAPAKKPGKKPAAKVAKEKLAKDADRKKMKLPPVFPTLKPNKMTERKLKGMRDKNGDVRFLLNWHFSDAMVGHDESGDPPRQRLFRAVEATVCPTDEYEIYDTEFTLFGALVKQKLITLLVKTKVAKKPEVDPNAAAKAEEPLPPLDTTGTGMSTETHRHVHGPGIMEDVPKSRAFDPNPTNAKDTGGLPRIEASVSTDDKTYDGVPFDATMWFEVATDKELRQLARDGWKHEESSDRIAEFMRDHDADVKAALDYVDSIKGTKAKKDQDGFSVEVDKELALEWIGNHRPHLAEDIAKIETGEQVPEPGEAA